MMSSHAMTINHHYNSLRILADETLDQINSGGVDSETLFLLQMQEHFLRGAERTMLKRLNNIEGKR